MFTRIALVFSLMKLMIPVPFSCWHWRGTVRRRQWHTTPVLLPGKSHGRRSLVGCSPWGCEESDRTERLHFHFSLLCIGERNGNPLHCSCLENPRDGVAQSRTRLKWLSSSSSSRNKRAALWPGRQAGRTLAAVQTIDCSRMGTGCTYGIKYSNRREVRKNIKGGLCKDRNRSLSYACNREVFVGKGWGEEGS